MVHSLRLLRDSECDSPCFGSSSGMDEWLHDSIVDKWPRRTSLERARVLTGLR